MKLVPIALCVALSASFAIAGEIEFQPQRGAPAARGRAAQAPDEIDQALDELDRSLRQIEGPAVTGAAPVRAPTAQAPAPQAPRGKGHYRSAQTEEAPPVTRRPKPRTATTTKTETARRTRVPTTPRGSAASGR